MRGESVAQHKNRHDSSSKLTGVGVSLQPYLQGLGWDMLGGDPEDQKEGETHPVVLFQEL